MMKFTTSVDLPKHTLSIDYNDYIMMMGSCFTENIGKHLMSAKLKCLVNPYGTLYNPLSILEGIERLRQNQPFRANELFFYQGLWHSSMHHGSYSQADKNKCLEDIDLAYSAAANHLLKTNYLLFTWGSSYIYKESENQRVVANCHKLPESKFQRIRLSIEEIVAPWTVEISESIKKNPQLQYLFTVSPIRHLRDGLHQNQLSKSTLLLAINELQSRFPQQVHYFPAYELLNDELRDYRFYAEDMVHPSTVAQEYIWQRFVETCLSDRTVTIMKQVEDIVRSLSHRPLHPDSDVYQDFLHKILLKINQLKEKYPFLDVSNEINICRIQ